jgi:hypothetical protein
VTLKAIDGSDLLSTIMEFAAEERLIPIRISQISVWVAVEAFTAEESATTPALEYASILQASRKLFE